MKSCILWFRRDLRLTDHPALAYAISEGYAIIPLYLLEESEAWPMGEASRWWLHHALDDLAKQLESLGAKLCLSRAREGVQQKLLDFVDEAGVDAVFWSRRYEAEGILCDTDVKKSLLDRGVEAKSFSSNLINEPFEIANLAGGPYKVFTPYWKKCREIPLRALANVELERAFWKNDYTGESLENLELLPSLGWDAEFYTNWQPTRAGAEKLLTGFSEERAVDYNEHRDLLAENGTSRMGTYLAFGQISPIEICAQLDSEKAAGYIRQLYWRDFSYHLLYHFPYSDRKPLKEQWSLFPWNADKVVIKKWQVGQTGYPVVDAAMRQLWQTGWMHNRARMIVASVLVKHFQQDWMVGAQWFWGTLLDADLANNTMGWQWSAGCGADAAPYFRVFNPVTQGVKFDPAGEYVRKYVPELNKLPNKYLHCPWDAPEELLRECGIELGVDYPRPLLLPSEGREKALQAYQLFKESVESQQ
ncbi:cryptochrome/photolyase family protein [Rubritalea sp.]|uniref:cryptochrome/photolyase family protein n=1 Tax=Rubritalea sp. TaxID=2109375 RepID=UPI003EF30ADA